MEVKKISESKVGRPDAVQPLKMMMVIVGFIFIAWGLWFVFLRANPKGPEDAAKSDINLVNVADKLKKQEKVPLKDSYYKNDFKLEATETVFETFPDKEYLKLSVLRENLSGVDVSKWKLVNSRGETAVLGQGTSLVVSGKANALEPIVLRGGDVALVSSGRSPIGISFRKNQCSGFHEQFQDFIPAIRPECPMVTQMQEFGNLDFPCQQLLYGIPVCTIIKAPLPASASAACKKFVATKVNYNTCVSENKTSSFFYSNEWRIFLGREKDFWFPGDTATLLDEKGDVVDSIKFPG